MRAFVTGSGTDIGKTYVTTRWVEALRADGRPVTALKPVLSGMDGVPLEETDAGRLVAAMGEPVTPQAVATICPWQFAPPISPDMAAARVGPPLELAELSAFCREFAAENLIVEGVGGVMVPLNERALVLDWMVELDFSVVVVTGSYLGALSHTLTAVRSIETAGLRLAAVVVSQSETEPVPLTETVATLKRFCGAPVWALPRRGTLRMEQWRDLAARCARP